MDQAGEPESVKTASSTRRIVICAALLLAAFLFGFVPTWLKYRECSSSLSQAEHELIIARAANTLASAAIDARRGDFEPARQAASNFFTALRAEIDKVNDSALLPAQKEGLKPVLVPRDEIITLLARSDPAAANRLSDLYVNYRRIMKR